MLSDPGLPGDWWNSKMVPSLWLIFTFFCIWCFCFIRSTRYKTVLYSNNYYFYRSTVLINQVVPCPESLFMMGCPLSLIDNYQYSFSSRKNPALSFCFLSGQVQALTLPLLSFNECYSHNSGIWMTVFFLRFQWLCLIVKHSCFSSSISLRMIIVLYLGKSSALKVTELNR